MSPYSVPVVLAVCEEKDKHCNNLMLISYWTRKEIEKKLKNGLLLVFSHLSHYPECKPFTCSPSPCAGKEVAL